MIGIGNMIGIWPPRLMPCNVCGAKADQNCDLSKHSQVSVKSTNTEEIVKLKEEIEKLKQQLEIAKKALKVIAEPFEDEWIKEQTIKAWLHAEDVARYALVDMEKE